MRRRRRVRDYVMMRAFDAPQMSDALARAARTPHDGIRAAACAILCAATDAFTAIFYNMPPRQQRVDVVKRARLYARFSDERPHNRAPRERRCVGADATLCRAKSSDAAS